MQREVAVEHFGRLDLVPVVVFGIHPEHRDRRDVVLGLDAARQLNGGGGLE